MTKRRRAIERRTVLSVAAAIWLFAAAPAFAQPDRTRDWLGAIAAVRGASASPTEERQAQIVALRRQIEEWLALNPGLAATLPPAPALPWSDHQRNEQIAILDRAIDQIARGDPNRPFYLGVVSVNVTAPVATLSPLSDSFDAVEIQRRQALTVDKAIEYLPGVSVDHRAPRNQTGISIGGFDSRQVPLYLDGIPAYAPFDGYVDLTRYLTSDVAEVQVAKGFTSPLLGPNLLGGVVNIVTRQPQKGLEGAVSIRAAAGNRFDAGLQVGSRSPKYFVQASADGVQQDSYPLSASFGAVAAQPVRSRVNADLHDQRYRIRVGWTPRSQDEYVVSVSSQRGDGGIPPYAGTAPACPSGGAAPTTPCVTPKFWKQRSQDADHYYVNSRTALGAVGAIQLRAFYAGYSNRLDMFDDATYSSMTQNASSGVSVNDDHSAGIAGQFEARPLRQHTLAASFFVSDDTHTEQTTTFSRSGTSATTPRQRDRDRQSSFGIRDAITLAPALRATVGISVDRLNGLEAQDLTADRTRVVPFQVAGLCTAAPGAFDSCTAQAWTFNPVGALIYRSDRGETLHLSFAHKSRFPTLKDRYSYKAGRALPNPALEPERANTWTAGYSRAIRSRTVAQIELFRSDVRDEITNIFFLSPLCAGGGRGTAGSCQQAVNVGSELHAGVNLTARTTAVPRLTIDANYSFLHRAIDEPAGALITGTPRHKAIVSATARLPHDVTALASLRHLTGMVAMSDNGLALPATRVTSVDLSGMWPVRAGVSVQAGVQNLLDANAYYWEGFPEPGRSGYVLLRFAF